MLGVGYGAWGVGLVGARVCPGFGARVCPGFGARVSPRSNGLGVGAEVGIAVGTGKVGVAVANVVGEPVWSRVGISVGLIVGSSVVTARQVGSLALTQSGLKLSNCWKFWNTEANPHIFPVLFSMFTCESINRLPKTTTFDTPIVLFRKQLCSTVRGPKVSMI
jgi:hypothetical protein